MEIDAVRTVLVITDPQNDFLSPEGVTWGVVGESRLATSKPGSDCSRHILIQEPREGLSRAR